MCRSASLSMRVRMQHVCALTATRHSFTASFSISIFAKGSEQTSSSFGRAGVRLVLVQSIPALISVSLHLHSPLGFKFSHDLWHLCFRLSASCHPYSLLPTAQTVFHRESVSLARVRRCQVTADPHVVCPRFLARSVYACLATSYLIHPCLPFWDISSEALFVPR